MAGGGIRAGDGEVRVDAAGFETVVRAELRCGARPTPSTHNASPPPPFLPALSVPPCPDTTWDLLGNDDDLEHTLAPASPQAARRTQGCAGGEPERCGDGIGRGVREGCGGRVLCAVDRAGGSWTRWVVAVVSAFRVHVRPQ